MGLKANSLHSWDAVGVQDDTNFNISSNRGSDLLPEKKLKQFFIHDALPDEFSPRSAEDGSSEESGEVKSELRGEPKDEQ